MTTSTTARTAEAARHLPRAARLALVAAFWLGVWQLAALAVGQRLLLPAPGEEHTVGLGVLAESLRRAGWAVWGAAAGSIESICAEVASGRFDVVALSVSCHRRLDLIDASVRAVRVAAAGRDVGLLIVGPQEVELATD